MAKENPMPTLIVHVMGLVFSAGLVWGCYMIWHMTPDYTGGTVLSPLRIVCSLLAMFVLLSLGQLLIALIRRAGVWGR